MGLFSWLTNRSASPEETRATNINVLDRLSGVLIGRESMAGTVVNEISALQVSTVMACVSRVSLDVASLPIRIYRRNRDGTSEEMTKVRIADLLQRRPNSVNTAAEVMQMTTAHSMLRGDGFMFVQRGLDGEPTALWPLHHREVSVTRTGFEPEYMVNAYEGQLSGRYSRRNILHLRQQTMDGMRGIDRLLYAKNSIGLSQAAQDTQSKTYKNGNRMPGYWSTDASLAEATIDRIATALRSATSGENQWKSPLLDQGLSYKPTGQNFDEAQLVETRQHERIEVCAAFNVLPAVLGIDDKTQAFASVEAMFVAHLRHTLRPWLVAWEQTIDRDLLDGLGPLYCKFDTSDMEKATTKERAESYRSLMETLVYTPNEARAREGLPPIKGLDELWIEIQKGKAGLAEPPAAEPPPAADPPPPPPAQE